MRNAEEGTSSMGKVRAVAALVVLAVIGAIALSGTAFGQAASGSATPFAAVSPSATGSSSTAPITFTFADTAEPDSLNAMVGYSGTDYTFWAMNYNLLVEYGAADFKPDYAHSITTSVDSSPDLMTFTYHLRPDMKWSDGKPFTAEDVAWTLNYYKKYEVPNWSSDLTLFDKAVATDPTTVVITSTEPTVLFTGKSVFFNEYILPKHIWEKYDDDYAGAKRDLNVPSVGSGPFIITKYVKAQYVEADSNPYYWGKSVGLTPNVDRVVYRIFGNQDAEAAALQNGDVDFGYFTSGNILNTLEARGVNTRGAVIPSFGEIAMNNGSAFETNTTGGFKPHGDGAHALTDIVVRQAIRRAIDSEVLLHKVLLDYGTTSTTPVQPTAITGPWAPGPGDPDLSWNIQAANDMLDAAGYKMGPDDVRIDPKTGEPLDFSFYSRQSDQASQDIVPYVEAWLQQIGIKIEPQTVYSFKLGNIILTGDYDMFEWGWLPYPDPNTILQIFTCAQRPPDADTYRNSDMYYCNPEYDKLFAAQGREADLQKRSDIVHQMQAILYRDQPYIMLWNDALLEAWNSNWTGYQSQPAKTGDLLATYGPFSFISLRPVTGTSAGTGTTGAIPGWAWLAFFTTVVVGFVGVRVRRRYEDSEDVA
jgi:peptide/nickel transport system substrate-binding protein